MVDLHQDIESAVERLAVLLDVCRSDLAVQIDDLNGGGALVEAIVSGVYHAFIVEFKSASSLASVALVTSQLKIASSNFPKTFVPLLVVPFMPQSGREHCREAGVSWLDLSGNARIVAPGLYVYVEGYRNSIRVGCQPPSGV